MEEFQNYVNEASLHAQKLEQKIEEIEQFYSNYRKKKLIAGKLSNSLRNKDKGRHGTTSRSSPTQQDNGKAASERMQALISQFRIIFNQITRRLGACSFLDSAADDQDLHHSSEPKDFNSIRRRMEAKDDSGYKHVRDVYFDVRSVLNNVKKNNDERSDVYMTADTLLNKFTDKWFLLLPEIMQEDERLQEEEGDKHAHHAQVAKDVSDELCKLDLGLNELRERVLQRRNRRMSTLEKKDLVNALTKLSVDDLTRALEIVAQGNPSFEANAEEVDLDINAQSESTLWRLKYFIVETCRAQRNQTSDGGDQDNVKKENAPANPSKPHESKSDRIKETGDDRLFKPSTKKNKKAGLNL